MGKCEIRSQRRRIREVSSPKGLHKSRIVAGIADKERRQGTKCRLIDADHSGLEVKRHCSKQLGWSTLRTRGFSTYFQTSWSKTGTPCASDGWNGIDRRRS